MSVDSSARSDVEGLLIKPETLHAFNARITALATELKVTCGRKLRTDGTVVETNIAYPRDSKLLADGGRFELAYQKHREENVTLVGGVAPTAVRFARYLRCKHKVYPKDLWNTQIAPCSVRSAARVVQNNRSSATRWMPALRRM